MSYAMDPTRSGHGASLASLILLVAAGVKNDYQIFLGLERVPENHLHEQIRLYIEHARFNAWAKEIGIVNDVLVNPSRSFQQNQSLILNVLLQIHQTMESIWQVPNKPTTRGSLASLSSEPGAQSRNLTLGKSVHPWSFATRAADDLTWESIQADKVGAVTMKIIECNQILEDMLDGTALERLRANVRKTCLTLIEAYNNVDQAQALTKALRLQINTSNGSSHGLITSASTQPVASDVETDMLVNLAGFKSQIGTQQPDQEDLRKLVLDTDSLNMEDIATTQRRIQFTAWGRQLWVEWADGLPEVLEILSLPFVIEDRIARLAHLLQSSPKPSSLRSPPCAGYFRYLDPVFGLRIGLVYEAVEGTSPPSPLPSGTEQKLGTKPLSYAGTEIVIITLRNILRIRRKASLSHRIVLSVKLAESLNDLHAVGLLHRGLRSDSVLFFNHIPPPAELQQTTSSRSSVISTGNPGTFLTSPSLQTPQHTRTRQASLSVAKPVPVQPSIPEVDLTSPILSGLTIAFPELPDELATSGYQTRLEDDMYRHPSLLRRLNALSNFQNSSRHRPKSPFSPTSGSDASTFPKSYTIPFSSDEDKHRKPHDIYSFGLVLLEIALWLPLEQIVDPPLVMGARDTRAQIFRIREGLLQTPWRGWEGGIKEAVAAEMGDGFAEAVFWCLNVSEELEQAGSVEGKDVLFDVEAPHVSLTKEQISQIKVQRGFQEQVLDRIRQIRI